MVASVPSIDEGTSRMKRKGKSKGIEIVDLESDSFCFTPLKDNGSPKSNSISVAQYSEERDLRLSVKISTTPSVSNLIGLANYDDDLSVLDFKPSKTPSRKKRKKEKKPFSDHPITEPGEVSNSKAHQDPAFVCEICVEPKQANELFNIKGCSHAYCTDCMVKYVASRLQDKITGGGNALCEAMVLGSQKFYCPFKDCSMLLIDDGGETVRD
ncbi:RING/U-box superfamily protein, putative isoform 2 [Hibiscus syriacus]|uniref:RING/U-box superfamily protein, putative isoform 2 n=1 Tax=Hibiscus syriacus TaxID=106335 RepID=A0A6A2YI82_HIBSY|nr:RING/U-box superfamily protein, putative isoform 2 [Hibiscus syriacus]